MTGLVRRLTALEALAEGVRRQGMRDLVMSLPEARDLTPGELEEAVDEAIRYQDRFAAWRSSGVSEREMIQRCADELGVTAEELKRRCASRTMSTGSASSSCRCWTAAIG